MRQYLHKVLLITGCMLAMHTVTSTCQAGILMPEQVTFDENDLAASLATRDSASSTASTSTSSASAPVRRIQRDWWSEEDRGGNVPFELSKSKLPTGTTSSSTSSSPVAGATSSTVVCLLSAPLNLQDDAPLGQLAEDHGLSLPDPPGTDLLRPPRY